MAEQIWSMDYSFLTSEYCNGMDAIVLRIILFSIVILTTGIGIYRRTRTSTNINHTSVKNGDTFWEINH